jgi:glycosyl transferase family 22 (putative mannosyltransferase)
MPNRLLLVSALAVTLTLAVVGIDWGLPYNWHADEKVNLAASMIDRHTLDPDYFVNPSLHVYLVLALVRVAYAVHPGTFVPSDVRWHVLSTRRTAPNRAVTFLAYRLARLWSAACAVWLVWLLWTRGRAAFDDTVGLLAAGSLSVTMGLANLAHFATPETTLFVLVLAALGSCERLTGVRPGSDRGQTGVRPGSDRGQTRVRPGSDQGQTGVRRQRSDPGLTPYLRTGALIGLACSTKYTVWLLAIPFAAAHLRRHDSVKRALRAWPLMLTTAGAAAIAFVAATPYSILDARRFLEDMWFNWVTGAPEGSLAGQRRSWIAYLMTLGNALGWPLFALAVAGTVVVVSRWRRLDERGAAAVIVHGSWLASFWLFYGISPHHALRFIMPVVPSLLLLGSAGVMCVARQREYRRPMAVTVGVVFLYSLAYATVADWKFLRDPRYAAGAWLKAHAAPDMSVGYFTNEAYLPYFDRPNFRIQFLDVMSQSGIVGQAFDERIAHLVTDGPDLIVDANFYYDRFLDAPNRFPERAAFYRQMLGGSGVGGFRPLARFSIASVPWLDPRPELVAPEVVIFGRPRPRAVGLP